MADDPVVLTTDPALHSPQYTQDVSALVAEALRVLNYAMGPHAGHAVDTPETIYAVLGDLSAAFGRVPQLLESLSRQIRLAVEEGFIEASGPYTPEQAANRITSCCDESARYAQRISGELNQAHSTAADLSLVWG